MRFRHLAGVLARWGFAGAFAGALGCGDDPLERVRVCGDLLAPDELTAVRVVLVRADGGRDELSAGVVELVSPDGLAIDQLPIVVSLSTASGTHVVRAQGIGANGAEIIRSEVLVGNDEDDAGDVVVNLAGDCIGMMCALGQTCVGGACTVIPEARGQRCDTPAGGGP